MASMIEPRRTRQLWVDVAILLGLCLVLFFSQLGDRPLWDIDEGMHAATSKDMILTGDWVTPTMNGEKFYDKPPLFNWLVAFSFLLFGFTEFAARLPAAVLGTACVFATYILARKMFGRLAGLLSGVILATSLEFLLMAQVVVHDVALALAVTLALLFFWFAFHDEKRRRLFLLLFYISCGFSVLAKGPLGLVLVGMVVGPWLVMRRRLDFLKDMGLWWGTVVFLAVAGPWYVAVMRANADFGAYFFIQQNFMNFASSEAARHAKPWHFYFPILIGGFFPWIAFLPAAVGNVRRKWREDHEGALLFLSLWAGLIFLFFSIASSKLPSYLLPMFPAVAVLVAVSWRDLLIETTPKIRRQMLIALGLMALILLAGFTYSWFFELPDAQAKYKVDVALYLPALLVLLGGLFVALALFWRGLYRSCFAAIASTVVVLMFLLNTMVLPVFSPFRTTGDLGLRLDAVLPEGERIVFYKDLRDSILFYTPRTGRILRNLGEFREHMAQDAPAF